MEETVAAPRHRLRRLQPVPGAPRVLRVGKEGRPRRGRGKRRVQFVGVDWRVAVDRGAQRTGETVVPVGGGGGG